MKIDTSFFVNKIKKTYIFVSILILIILFSGVTFSLWTWISDERTNIVFSIDSNFRCEADGGGNISSSDVVLAPATCMSDTFAIKREVKVTPTLEGGIGVSLNLWLNVDKIGSGLYNSNNFMYALTTNSNSCTDGVVSSGNFKNKRAGSTVSLLDSIPYSRTTTDTYYLYIWLDEAETSTTTMKQEFSLSLGGTCLEVNSVYTDVLLNGADPVLDDGMIPIILSNDGIATVADIKNEWYNYGEKEWANMVLVNKEATDGIDGSYSREYYLDNPGTTIIESDILAYYVWIPRYRYQIWTVNAAQTTDAQTINIVFENKDITKSNGSAVGEYYTHPAFTFGDDEVNGIWVGKFETTGDATTPTIKPNLQSLRSQDVSTQFQTLLKFSGGTMNTSTGSVSFSGSDIYGLTSDTDSHMMKNSEWGAVAYLSHSQYGINQEIYINNSSSYYTGRSGGNVGGGTEYNTYGYYTWIGQLISSNGVIGEVTDLTFGTKASTTGNLTGVYDMSGGSYEYVMGNYNNIIGSSGFSILPDIKYYNLYLISSMSSCTLETCGGHALFEVAGWYDDSNYFVDSNNSWFERSGGYDDEQSAGVFFMTSYVGYDGYYDSCRSVLIS